MVFGLGWFAIFLLPLCNLIPLGNTPVAQHYLFVPSIGLALALSTAAASAVRRAWARNTVALAAVLAACLCAAFAVETQRAVAAWGDEERLYARTLDNHPDTTEALVNLSDLYLQKQDYERARSLLVRARRLAPSDAGVVRNQFSLLWQTGQPEAALALLESAPSLAGQPEFLIRKAEALERLARYPEAAAAFEHAFALATDKQDRFVAGFRLFAVLLRIDRRAHAEVVLQALLREYPEREELRALRSLLRPRVGE